MITVSQTALYALRAMAYLAVMSDRGPVASADLASQTSIPPHYISKVMTRMVRAGLCVAQRGHHGGFTLTRPPQDVTFAEIINAVDPATGQPACAFGYDACDEARPCALHDSWSNLKRRHADWAATTTLASIRNSAARAGFSARLVKPPSF
jgi:Rrf2 family protein